MVIVIVWYEVGCIIIYGYCNCIMWGRLYNISLFLLLYNIKSVVQYYMVIVIVSNGVGCITLYGCAIV